MAHDSSQSPEPREGGRRKVAATVELDAGFPRLPYQTVPNPPTVNGDPNPYFGRVVYGPGLAVDQPLSATRYRY